MPLDSSPVRGFETAITPQDTLTLRMDLTGLPALSNLTVNGTQTAITTKVISGRTNLVFNLAIGTNVQNIVVNLANALTNHPPVSGTLSNLVVNELTPITVTNTASDPDFGQTLTYILVNTPVGVQIDNNGIITWTPSEAQGPGVYTVTTVATDNGFPALSATNSFTVIVNEINVAPVLPAQPNRTLYLPGSGALVVTNTATDADIPANTLTYQLVNGPSTASIDGNGIITWTPTLAQVSSTNIFTTVVTDYNPWSVNSQHLSATNSFSVVVSAPKTPWLPALSNLTVNGGQLILVSNAATEAPFILSASNSFLFTYPSRNELLADGWSFTATNPNGTPRPTENTNPNSAAIISYDQVAHPGIMRIPVDAGDLFGPTPNNSTNSIFRYLPPNWLSMRLHVALNPTLDYQQAHLLVYQDDDDYIQVGMAYNNSLNTTNGEVITVVWEKGGSTAHYWNNVVGVTNVYFRLDRNPNDGSTTGFYSLDQLNWVAIGGIVANQGLVNTRLGFWCGTSALPYVPGMANADLYEIDLTVPASVPTVLTYALLSPPAGVTTTPMA